MNELATIPHSRELKDVTRDIRYQTGQFLRTAIEIGRLLFEAKDMVEPGGWGKYIEEELPFSHSWANNYMKLYKEYGSDQTSLFGDSQAFMNLRPTQALELLALTAEKREKFMETHEVKEMSTRELHKEIQEALEQTRAELRDAEQEKMQLRNQVEVLKSTEGAWDAEIKKQREKAAAARKALEDTEKKLKAMTDKANAAAAKATESQKKLQDLQQNPEIPASVMEELQQQAMAEAAKKAAEDTQKEFERLDQELRKAEAAALAAEEKLSKLQKQSQTADPDIAVFKALFQQVQEDFNRLNGALKKINEKDPETGRKIHGALKALWNKLREEIS